MSVVLSWPHWNSSFKMSIRVFEKKISSSSNANHRLEKWEFGLKPRFPSETTNGNGGRMCRRKPFFRVKQASQTPRMHKRLAHKRQVKKQLLSEVESKAKVKWRARESWVVVVGTQSQIYINFALHVYLKNSADLTLQLKYSLSLSELQK
jgi:hypothetical protein